MINYIKSKKQNAAEIRTELLKFIGFFLVLVCISFLCLYFFASSYSKQRKVIEDNIVAYKEILNKQQVLKPKLDSLMYRMSVMNTDRVSNNAFLANYIYTNIQEVKKVIGKDSLEFKHYYSLVNRLDSMMQLKVEVMNISAKFELTKSDLEQCMGQNRQIRHSLAQDPSRSFSGR